MPSRLPTTVFLLGFLGYLRLAHGQEIHGCAKINTGQIAKISLNAPRCGPKERPISWAVDSMLTSLNEAYLGGRSIDTVNGPVELRGPGGLVVSGNVVLNNSGLGNLMRPDNRGVAFQLGNDTNRSFGPLEVRNGLGSVANLTILDSGNTGVGTARPTNRFEVNNPESGMIFRVTDGGTTKANGIFEVANGLGNVTNFVIQDGGNVGIGTSSPGSKLDVAGSISTQVLTITGGADIAESIPNARGETMQPGDLVVIDVQSEGAIRLSSSPYDSRVAGIVSGAAGISPGVTLSEGRRAESGPLVAVAGRVYTRATASNGAIRPGDLLTTSAIPGHAMKAVDATRRSGAVIGKAMSSLEFGEGLVLVLVSLQ